MNEFNEKYKYENEPWSADHEKYNSLHNFIFAFARKHTKKVHDTAYDIACGTGWFTKIITEDFERVYGLDISEIAIGRAKKINANKKIEYIVADAYNPDFKVANFDVLFLNEVLYYYTPIQNYTFLKRIEESLGSESIVVVSIKQHDADSLKKLESPIFSNFELIEKTNFEGHIIYALGKKNKLTSCLITYDWELSERSIVSEKYDLLRIEDELVRPLSEILKSLNSDIFITIFVEINQIYELSKRYQSIREIIQEIKTAEKSGSVQIGLHVHPNWDLMNGASVDIHNVKYAPSNYKYLECNSLETVKIWFSMFHELFGFNPEIFRSGKYRPLPDSLKYALVKFGIKIFSTELATGSILADNGDYFDYSQNATKKIITEQHLPSGIVCNVLINSGGGIVLDSDHNSFCQKITRCNDKRLITFVSHPKDIKGDRLFQHLDNLAIIRKYFKIIKFDVGVLNHLSNSEFFNISEYLSDNVTIWIDNISKRFDLRLVDSKSLCKEIVEFIRIRCNECGVERKIIYEIVVYSYVGFSLTLLRGLNSYHWGRLDFNLAKALVFIKYYARKLIFCLPESFVSAVRYYRAGATMKVESNVSARLLVYTDLIV